MALAPVSGPSSSTSGRRASPSDPTLLHAAPRRTLPRPSMQSLSSFPPPGPSSSTRLSLSLSSVSGPSSSMDSTRVVLRTSFSSNHSSSSLSVASPRNALPPRCLQPVRPASSVNSVSVPRSFPVRSKHWLPRNRSPLTQSTQSLSLLSAASGRNVPPVLRPPFGSLTGPGECCFCFSKALNLVGSHVSGPVPSPFCLGLLYFSLVRVTTRFPAAFPSECLRSWSASLVSSAVPTSSQNC